MGSEDHTIVQELASSEVLYLYDAGTRKYALLPVQASRLIAFSSPSSENTSELIKLRLVSLHMPMWSLDELLHASKLDHYRGRITDTLVADLFDNFGGIARYVLESHMIFHHHWLWIRHPIHYLEALNSSFVLYAVVVPLL